MLLKYNIIHTGLDEEGKSREGRKKEGKRGKLFDKIFEKHEEGKS